MDYVCFNVSFNQLIINIYKTRLFVLMYREQAKSVYRKLMFADFQWKHEREYIPNVNNDYFI